MREENDKEDTFNISHSDNNQWASEYKETQQIQYLNWQPFAYLYIVLWTLMSYNNILLK